MKAKDLATKHTYYVAPTVRLGQVAAEMRWRGLTIVPVCDNAKLVGVITDKDVVINYLTFGTKALACTVGEFMTLYPMSIPADVEIVEAAEIMTEAKVLNLPVVEDGFFMGVISLRDVARTLGADFNPGIKELAEIFVPVQAISLN